MYASPNTIWVTKSRRMRWEGHVARMGKREGLYKVCGGEMMRGKGHMEGLDVDGRIILKRFFINRMEL
jgi:hypothetical protein